MKPRTLQRERSHETPSTKARGGLPAAHERETDQTYREQPTLRGKTYSFQDLPGESLNSFCSQVQEVHALLQVGKRLTDPNVLMLNSTQKELVEMIIDNNKHSSDDKARYLTQRATRYVKLLWRTEKFNDALLQQPPQPKHTRPDPHYASPIHNFKKPKDLTPPSNRTHRSPASRPRRDNLLKEDPQQPQATSRTKRINSEDHKFSNVRLHKHERDKRKGEKQKSFEVDLTKNMAWKTMNTTKNFENMLKILKEQ